MNEKEIPNPDEIEETYEDKVRARTVHKIFKPQALPPPKEEDVEPIPAEPPTPLPHQTPVLQADSNAKVIKATGSQFPMVHTRPQAPQMQREEGSVIVAKALAEQLGTDPMLKAQMRIDERKLSVLSDQTLASLSHFSYRYVYDGVRYWGHITEWWLTGSQGIGGLGRRHILQAISNSSGVQTVDKAEKPNVIARNLWDRGWKKKAESEGKVVEE